MYQDIADYSNNRTPHAERQSPSHNLLRSGTGSGRKLDFGLWVTDHPVRPVSEAGTRHPSLDLGPWVLLPPLKMASEDGPCQPNLNPAAGLAPEAVGTQARVVSSGAPAAWRRPIQLLPFSHSLRCASTMSNGRRAKDGANPRHAGFRRYPLSQIAFASNCLRRRHPVGGLQIIPFFCIFAD